MKKIMGVCILDTDRFFILGIKFILLRHFKSIGQEIFFVGEESIKHADLVFWSALSRLPGRLCRRAVKSQTRPPVYIQLCSRQRDDLRCTCEQGMLWRGASPGDLLTLVEKRLGVRETLTLPVTACGSCALLKLTRSEVRVISCMAQEMSPVSLPQYLKISPKTISAHKRSVMRKLGFKRNEELYHWLRSGGLEQIERPLP
ncbi:helix-turn-helix transcriptional regulator [Erwinia tasmaniensis]|uniref:HTH luxR-type domain-containing protein n=1 Tax=Erwinia tasmaniensis (strain DSM 17950 / CFBP 7177 / CIP 109463 / NCPPB 4357 / Et1/99) TaxID=465817 RepID=B2VL70_ERWT9|nr:helix-turn-helix transcriptional regulator [Erwinia tasmaniensis]CAO95315.1 hypothetical protein ETA_02690 [Erwinia tasmaniensis Et1/99]